MARPGRQAAAAPGAATPAVQNLTRILVGALLAGTMAVSTEATAAQANIPGAGCVPAGPNPIGCQPSAHYADFTRCSPADQPTIIVGQVSCQQIDSPDMGTTVAFSYYIPADCDPALGRHCPVIYELHGSGGDYTSLLGTADDPSPYVLALTSRPPVDATKVSDPWDYSDPSKWVPAPPIDAILVGPQDRTPRGGYGPQEGLDGLWIDWNPKYALGGSDPKYDTPPPRFESHLLDEVMPYVQEHFGAPDRRAWRAISGFSEGGYGAANIGIRHPDLFAVVAPNSSGYQPWGAAAVHWPGVGNPVGLPVSAPYQPLPDTVPTVEQKTGFQASPLFPSFFYGDGDPVADGPYYESETPIDNAINAKAYANGQQSVYIERWVGDTLPRAIGDQGMEGEDEAIQFNVAERRAFVEEGLQEDFHIRPGTHTIKYWAPFIREELETIYAHLRHWDGSGEPPLWPRMFDYRTNSTNFSIWNWRFQVTRQTAELLNMWEVSCHRFTLQGTGLVTVTVPTTCHTGIGGSRSFTVNLGGTYPTDDAATASDTPAYGRTATYCLTRIKSGGGGPCPDPPLPPAPTANSARQPLSAQCNPGSDLALMRRDGIRCSD